MMRIRRRDSLQESWCIHSSYSLKKLANEKYCHGISIFWAFSRKTSLSTMSRHCNVVALANKTAKHSPNGCSKLRKCLHLPISPLHFYGVFVTFLRYGDALKTLFFACVLGGSVWRKSGGGGGGFSLGYKAASPTTIPFPETVIIFARAYTFWGKEAKLPVFLKPGGAVYENQK